MKAPVSQVTTFEVTEIRSVLVTPVAVLELPQHFTIFSQEAGVV